MNYFKERPYREDELEKLHSLIPNNKEKVKQFGIAFFMAGLLPGIFLVIILFDKSYSSDTKFLLTGLYFAIIFALALYIYYISGFLNFRNPIVDSIKKGKVFEINLDVIKISRRKDLYFEHPSAYYFTCLIEGKEELIYLKGEFIKDLEKQVNFPNSKMQIVLDFHQNILLSYQAKGHIIDKIKEIPPHQDNNLSTYEVLEAD
jgi:hypothetical protein